MSHSTGFKVSAVIMAAFGVVLVLAPNLLLKMHGALALNSPGNYNSMLYGSLLLALAVINWTSASAGAQQVRNVVLGNLVGDVLGLAVTLYLQATDPVVPSSAWSNVVIFAVFTVLFGRLLLRSRATPGLPGAAPAA